MIDLCFRFPWGGTESSTKFRSHGKVNIESQVTARAFLRHSSSLDELFGLPATLGPRYRSKPRTSGMIRQLVGRLFDFPMSIWLLLASFLEICAHG